MECFFYPAGHRNMKDLTRPANALVTNVILYREPCGNGIDRVGIGFSDSRRLPTLAAARFD